MLPLDENLHARVRVAVPTFRKSDDGTHAVYDIATTIENGTDAGTYACTRRYREFLNVSKIVKSSFVNSHMYSSIPKLPGRQLKILKNHMSEEFLAKRRGELHFFMEKLLRLPRVMQLPSVRAFLGVVPQTAQSDAFAVECIRPRAPPKEQLAAAKRGAVAV